MGTLDHAIKLVEIHWEVRGFLIFVSVPKLTQLQIVHFFSPKKRGFISLSRKIEKSRAIFTMLNRIIDGFIKKDEYRSHGWETVEGHLTNVIETCPYSVFRFQ